MSNKNYFTNLPGNPPLAARQGRGGKTPNFAACRGGRGKKPPHLGPPRRAGACLGRRGKKPPHLGPPPPRRSPRTPRRGVPAPGSRTPSRFSLQIHSRSLLPRSLLSQIFEEGRGSGRRQNPTIVEIFGLVLVSVVLVLKYFFDFSLTRFTSTYYRFVCS